MIKIKENQKDMSASSVGVLLLHGFTSSLKAVDGLVPFLKKYKIPYKIPILRGHSSSPQSLAKTRFEDWYQDAQASFEALSKEVDQIIVVGLSMGGLLTLKRSMEYPNKIVGIVTVAAALKFSDPLAGLSSFLSKIIPYWPSPQTFNDKNLAKHNTNYKWFSTKAFASLYKASCAIEKELGRVKVPLLIIHSKKDRTIPPRAAEIIFAKVGSKQKEIVWFENSGHEMMQDLEAKAVFEKIMQFIIPYLSSNSK